MSTNDNPNRRAPFDGKFAGDTGEFNHKTDYASLDAEGRAKLEKWMQEDGERRYRENLERPLFKISDEDFERIDKQLFPNDPKREWEADMRRRADS